MAQSLVAFDTNRIKEYVFATGKLAEIRGASALLDRLNREVMLNAVGGTQIYAHGGGGLFLVPSDNAEVAIQTVQRQYRDTTGAASITGVQIGNFSDEDDLQSYWQQLSLRLRAAKVRNPAQVSLLAHPFLRSCDSCGTYYAAHPYAEPGGREVILCRSCHAKRQEDQRIKSEISALLSGQLQPRSQPLWHKLISKLAQAGYPFGDLERPEDFNTLGDQSSPGGYLGLIYADGDDMGRRLEQIHSTGAMRRFATTIDSAVYGAVEQAILEHLIPGSNAESLPFDVLLLGGDDLIMVTTAQSAIQTALTVMEHFSTLTAQHLGERMSLSVAVVLAHVNFPIRSLVDLAESALKFAKKQRAERGLTEGLLNFLVVSSSSHLDFHSFYKDALESIERNTVVRRTMRPYTAEDMHRLIQARRDLAGVPSGKLEQLRSALFKSRGQAIIEALVSLLRWRDDNQQQRVKELVSDFATAQTAIFPWIQDDGMCCTPLLDLIELFDFVH